MVVWIPVSVATFGAVGMIVGLGRIPLVGSGFGTTFVARMVFILGIAVFLWIGH